MYKITCTYRRAQFTGDGRQCSDNTQRVRDMTGARSLRIVGNTCSDTQNEIHGVYKSSLHTVQTTIGTTNPTPCLKALAKASAGVSATSLAKLPEPLSEPDFSGTLSAAASAPVLVPFL